MTELGGNSREQLRSIIERVENLNNEIKGLSDDRSDIFKEAAGNGFDVKALKAIIRYRKEDASKREELEIMVEAYKQALGENV